MCNHKQNCILNPEVKQPNISDDLKLQLFIASDGDLCALMAHHSGKGGDRTLLRAARLELERRTELKHSIALLKKLEQDMLRTVSDV